MFEAVVDVQDDEDFAQLTEWALLEFRADVHRFFRQRALLLSRSGRGLSISCDYTGDLLRCSLHERETDYRLEVVADRGYDERLTVLAAIASELRRVRRELAETREHLEEAKAAALGVSCG